MSHNDTTYDSTVSGNNQSDSGMLHVPAQVQRDLGIALDDEVAVTLEDLDHEFIESISFTGPQTAGDSVTVPARIMREVGIDGGDEVTASFALPDADEVAEEVEESLSESPGAEATQEEVEESVDSLEDLFESDDEEEVEEEESEEGLGELFG